MTAFTLLPTAQRLPGSARGAFTATGAANITAAVNDSSDASYIIVNPSYTSNLVLGANVEFTVGSVALPAGARVKYVAAQARTARTTSPDASFQMRLHDGRMPAAATDWVATSNPHAPNGVVTTVRGPNETTAAGGALDQSYLNNVAIEAFFLFISGTIRIHELAVVGEYDMIPTATLTGPSGVVSTTTSPIVSWNYSDDLEQQNSYQVQVYDSAGTTIVVDSGQVVSSDGFYQLPINLPVASYKVRVRVAQNWAGAGGTFWSDWTALTAFSITTISPTAPSIASIVDSANGRVRVAAFTQQNLLDFSSTGFELGAAASWSVVNASVAATATPVRSGGFSCSFAVSVANGTMTSQPFPADLTLKYFAEAFVQSSGATKNAIVRIDWYTAAGAFVSSLSSSSIPTPSGSFTQISTASAVPPATTAYGRVVVQGVATGTYFVDDVYTMVPSTVSAPWSTQSFNTGVVDAANTMRGGIAIATPNLLEYNDASNELTTTNWAPNASTTTLVPASTTQALHGAQSLRTTRNTSTGTLQIDLATVPSLALSGTSLRYFAATPGTVYAGQFSIWSGAARTATMTVTFYDSTFATLTSFSAVGTSTLSAWATFKNTGMTAPAGTSWMSVSVSVAAVVVGEFHYLDCFMIAPVATPGVIAGTWYEGYHVRSATLVIEYDETGNGTYGTLVSFPLVNGQNLYTFDDYEVAPTGSARVYRARVIAVVDTLTYTSAYSPTASTSGFLLSGVWLHSLSNPSGTSHKFCFDGYARSSSFDTDSVDIVAAGRRYPMTEFGEHRKRSIAVSLAFNDTSNVDTSAFEALVQTQGRVLYRDGRGRRGRGTLSAASYTDQPNSGPSSASFTFSWKGSQPEDEGA